MSFASTMGYENYAEYDKLKTFVNIQGDFEAIGLYQRFNPSPYAVLDKKNKTLYVYSENGERISTMSVKPYSGDEVDRGGAGIYTYVGQKNQVFYGQAEKDQSVHGLFNGDAALDKGTTLYVIPESSQHRFRIRNRRLTFNARDVLKNRPNFNYSPRNLEIHNTEFSTDRSDSFSQRYVRSLQDEKPKLMEIYKLENDEYNMLAEFAYGVLAPETEFGKNWVYRIKELTPYLTSVLKGNGFDTDQNSRGPTQIKNIPEQIVKHYGIQKHELKIPENAAIATLGFAAEQLGEIRNRASQHPGISEETLQNYMYYLYQGRRGEIVKKTATPYFNIKIKQIREAIKGFHIEESF